MKALDEMNTDYIKRLNRLNTNNKLAYIEVSNYAKFSFNKSEKEVTIVLDDMLDHFLEAQANGANARDFFGDDFKGYAKELVNEISDEPKTKIYWYGLFICTLTIASCLIPLGIANFIKRLATGTPFELPLGSLLLLMFLFTFNISSLVVITINNAKENTFGSLKMKVVFILLFGVMFLMPIILFLVKPVGMNVEMKPEINTPIGIIAIVFAVLIYKRKIRMGGE